MQAYKTVPTPTMKDARTWMWVKECPKTTTLTKTERNLRRVVTSEVVMDEVRACRR